MLDGADFPSASSNIREESLVKENERLKALLLKHSISWVDSKADQRICRMSLRSVDHSIFRENSQKALPHLPMEIQLKILKYAMKCSTPIIDPFFKHRPEHLTTDEKLEQKRIPVQLLAVCKVFHSEGTKYFFANEFVFTQVAALGNFAKIPYELRGTIKNVTFRVVGRYYDNVASKRNIFDMSYHPNAPNFKIPIFQRPKGAERQHGVHAYCWHQRSYYPSPFSPKYF
jgi:hypothetical protein